MVTGGLGGCSGVYRLSFLLSFLPFFLKLSWTCVFLVAILDRTMFILESLFGLPRRRSREECTIEGAEMIQGVVGEGGAGGGGEGGEGGGDRGAGKGNWEKISELARMGMGRQVGTRYKQRNGSG